MNTYLSADGVNRRQPHKRPMHKVTEQGWVTSQALPLLRHDSAGFPSEECFPCHATGLLTIEVGDILYRLRGGKRVFSNWAGLPHAHKNDVEYFGIATTSFFGESSEQMVSVTLCGSHTVFLNCKQKISAQQSVMMQPPPEGCEADRCSGISAFQSRGMIVPEFVPVSPHEIPFEEDMSDVLKKVQEYKEFGSSSEHSFNESDNLEELLAEATDENEAFDLLTSVLGELLRLNDSVRFAIAVVGMVKEFRERFGSCSHRGKIIGYALRDARANDQGGVAMWFGHFAN